MPAVTTPPNPLLRPASANGLPAGGRRRARSLADEVVHHVDGAIQAGQWKPGDKLPTETEIMQAFGVSRTVVREAISKLQAAGVVETRHGVGTFVLAPRRSNFGIDPHEIAAAVDVLAVLELRISLETEAAGLAALRHTPQQLEEIRLALEELTAADVPSAKPPVEADLRFHLGIAKATGNRYFSDIMAHLGATLFPRSRVNSPKIAMEEPEKYQQRVNREHEEIYTAITRRDADAARAAMRMHLANSRERVRRAQQEAEAGKASGG